MATRSTNTFPELLQRLLGDVAQGMTLPDADMDFLTEVQGMIVGALRAPVTQMEEAGLLPAGPTAGPMGMPPGGAGPQMAPLPPGGGYMPQPAAPNADELRRLLNAGS